MNSSKGLTMFLEQGEGLAKYRKNCPGHTGVADDIRACLKKHGPCTVYRIAWITGLPEKRVKNALQVMLHKTGGIVATRNGRWHMVYSLYETPPKSVESQKQGKQKEDNRAPTITIGRGSRWGASLV